MTMAIRKHRPAGPANAASASPPNAVPGRAPAGPRATARAILFDKPLGKPPTCPLNLGLAGVRASSRLRRALLAAVLAASTGVAAAQSAVIMGRLFASPQERAALDAQRDAVLGPASVNGQPAPPYQKQGSAPPAPVADAPPPAPAPVQLNGVVRRSDGKSTVWLNQQPQVDGANALQDQTLSVRLSSGRQVILKPGQSFNPANGTVQDDAGQ